MKNPAILFLLPLLLIFTGCYTPPSSGPTTWSGFQYENPPETWPQTPISFDLDRTEADLKQLNILSHEMKALLDEAAQLRAQFSDNPDNILAENVEAQFMLLRYLQIRTALVDFLNFYRHGQGDTPDVHARGESLGMGAWLNISYADSRFTALFYGQKEIIALLNTAHPRFEIPQGFYDYIHHDMTNPNRNAVRAHAWKKFKSALDTQDSTLNHLQKSDQDYAHLIKRCEILAMDTRFQVDYILYAQHYGTRDFNNRIRHSDLEHLTSDMESSFSHGSYKTRGVVFADVARIKTRSFQLASFTDEQINEVLSKLQPGDVLLSYTAGYMSDVFLPGGFKHGITFIGSVEQRRAAGLSNDALTQAAISEHQAQELITRVEQAKTAKGDPANVIEAVAEGVIINSLDYLLKTHINRLLVLRPKISPAEREQQLITLFQYVGTGYDFKFDFLNDAYQCCTEVVYRTLYDKGDIDFTLTPLKKRWILDADGIAKYGLIENPEAFEFILFIDTSSKADGSKAVIHEGNEGIEKVKQLLNVPNN
ncbi:YiiX/YebB-like N1pC/P60 family cysteine hydrolase [Kiritimatiellota bacterium B12222]|nr:YiiX/YebB-like N1pC/P60 family cysteine hydrolase [Kiritimatiellota bacterium B12222]